jgi:dTDP-4-dehydrorhamnose 3,5-epimerase
MRIDPAPLDGCFIIGFARMRDERGAFMRTFDHQAFAAAGLSTAIDHTSLSFNTRSHTLRGLHYQAAPHLEDKLVRCASGAIFDVAVDLRPTSPTRGRWFGVVLSEENDEALYIPKGFAHGFLTLTENAVVSYQISEAYEPGLARGIRWDDPEIGIVWPHSPAVIGPRDRELPLFPMIKPDLT